MELFLSFLYNAGLVLLVVSVLAFAATWALNPTATPKEIFQHWNKTFKGG